MVMEAEAGEWERRIGEALEAAVAAGDDDSAPPGLQAAIRHAVFPGGARIRPRLCFAVARACGEDEPAVTDSAAAAIELLHCASLVHDDLPCFDDAATRRGRASVQQAFGERLAVLTGDALIVLAFQTLARGPAAQHGRLGPLVETVGASVGMPAGLAAGQAWECEPEVDLQAYQRAKTGALFAAATVAGAAAAGVEHAPWYALGERIGEAYQVVDDIRDVAGDAGELGKPTGQDRTHGRPSSAAELGVAGAVEQYERLMAGVVEAIPPCSGRDHLAELLRAEAKQLLPAELAETAA
jgi:geranylgeranyl diphosphate synthase type II